MAKYKIAVIGGDGIGPEVCEEALKVIDAAGISYDRVDYELGAAHYVKTKEVLPDSVLEELRGFDAILLGAIGPAIGSKDVPPGILERGLLLRTRFELDLYVNLRPFDGPANAVAEGASFQVVRENTEGPYAGEGGALRRGTPNEVATQGSVNTRFGVERCVRFAFGLARASERHKLHLVHKTNVLTYSGDLWERTVNEVATEFPDVSTDYCHVDAATIYLVQDAKRFDVIVTDNLFGDILTDLAGAVTGGIGLAASANLNPARTGPSMFEPVHGAAHDIAGTGKANPLAAIRSGAMMLEHLGEQKAADAIISVVLELQEEMAQSKTQRSTTEIGDLVAGRL
jgi:3-isopropylmalate dehydrogenase